MYLTSAFKMFPIIINNLNGLRYPSDLLQNKTKTIHSSTLPTKCYLGLYRQKESNKCAGLVYLCGAHYPSYSNMQITQLAVNTFLLN